ncbi:FAD-dependent oxidoreductase [Longibacter salinarum]|uniref:FAD-dependent oxidoreductase n=1 Tax=Longibacter salinarum TaxID=1850348 RepID=A0A2A8D1M8_9BACT|nr:NAD(P)/FAD-dependent oxidoreductase [Longibacter salinarum]PEN14791.1 FAD-dependent oxidoreductase [Longibacter salinarum]
MEYDVIVVGGGLAGCAAATHLAEAGHRVAVLEKGSFPRHKLCGEFLSPEVQEAFRSLGVLDRVQDAGAHEIDRACLTSPRGSTFRSDLPGIALGLSRYALDEMLFERAATAGADTIDGTRVTDISGSLSDGFTVASSTGERTARVVLGAFGKRSTLDRKLERPFLDKPSDLVAFKAHYRGPSVPRTIEIHTFPGGYCGISHVEDDRVNVCWIGNTQSLQDAGGSPEAMLNASLRRNPHLDDRLASAERVTDTFYAVSQVSLEPKSPFTNDVCMIGDTAGMIAPLCGDGMAMALTSAELATPFVDEYLRGTRSAESFREAYSQAWSDMFSLRMRVGRLAHAAAMRPSLAAATVGTLRLAPFIGRWLIRATRG